MKHASVADLRNKFARISKWIEAGETVEITKAGLLDNNNIAAFGILTSESGCIMMPTCGQRLLSTPTLTGF